MINNSAILLMYVWVIAIVTSCNTNKEDSSEEPLDYSNIEVSEIVKEIIIIDSFLSFEEALAGTKAPRSVTDQLTLLNVLYNSTDGRIHRGQIMTNKAIEEDVKQMFVFMLNNDFVIEKVIPMSRYNWNDSLSMDDNNTSSFCYRNVSYSKHATGMAIDINPRFNPLRWKNSDKPNQPNGATLDTTINGTLYHSHPVVKEFRRLGFRWGHTFSKYYDDHHFEKNK